MKFTEFAIGSILVSILAGGLVYFNDGTVWAIAASFFGTMIVGQLVYFCYVMVLTARKRDREEQERSEQPSSAHRSRQNESQSKPAETKRF